MKTIAGLFLGMFAGWFCAVGIIVFTTLVGVGVGQLGFTQYTFWYYILSVCLCVSLLIGSRAARQQIKFMMFFVIAVILVLGIGFLTFTEPYTSGDAFTQIQANMLGLAKLLAKVVMYVVPGALAAFYAFLAYEDLACARAVSRSGASREL
ncbi:MULTISPECIES: hypothetical protein [Pseudomonas]|uniref:Uncharacterized protein n=2 Tax=Pseudomonas TaxID=286 RepID=A0A7X1L071_9PSED|nr:MULTISPECIES: hypothetical protein [Pseudomonas]MBC2692606.1 hypothetical protein [Pseudomonas kielensis]MDD1009342.1 hypothetical protein [Pseudomonas shahriarae]